MNHSFTSFVDELQLAPLTKAAYAESLRLFDTYLAGKEPTERLVETYMVHMGKRGLGSASVNRHLSAIRAYFLWRKKHARPEKRGYWDLMVKGPKVHNKLPREIPSERVQAMVAAAENVYERALTMVLFDAALRAKELRGLQIEDIDFNKKEIRVISKGGDEDVLPLGDKTLAALRVYIGKRQGPVFPFPRWKLSQDLQRIASRAGVKKLHPHELRHARCQDLDANGVDIKDIQKFMRHKNITTTQIYLRGSTRKLRQNITPAF